MIKLFEKNDLSSVLEYQAKKVKEEISNLSDEVVLGTDFEEMTSYCLDKYYIEPIKLFMDNIQQTLSETKISIPNNFRYSYGSEYDYIDIPGYKITTIIPFSGDNELLYLRPSSRILSNFNIDNIVNSSNKDYGQIFFSMEYNKKELLEKQVEENYVLNAFNKQFGSYIKMIDYVNSDVKHFNDNLKSIIESTLEQRKQKTDDFIEVGKKLGIQLQRNPNAPNVKPILLKKTTLNKREFPKIQKPENDYHISDPDYDNIKQIINMAGFSIEKAARTFSKLEEEELRDIIISNLNTHYKAMATAETFSKVGKTDIHILFENKAAYIAECKIWHGAKKFNEAFSQLFSYTTWRDMKTSVIIFNKDVKSFEKVISTIDECLEKNSLCVNKIKTCHNEWHCKFKKELDSTNEIIVQVVVFDICVD